MHPALAWAGRGLFFGGKGVSLLGRVKNFFTASAAVTGVGAVGAASVEEVGEQAGLDSKDESFLSNVGEWWSKIYKKTAGLFTGAAAEVATGMDRDNGGALGLSDNDQTNQAKPPAEKSQAASATQPTTGSSTPSPQPSASGSPQRPSQRERKEDPESRDLMDKGAGLVDKLTGGIKDFFNHESFAPVRHFLNAHPVLKGILGVVFGFMALNNLDGIKAGSPSAFIKTGVFGAIAGTLLTGFVSQGNGTNIPGAVGGADNVYQPPRAQPHTGGPAAGGRAYGLDDPTLRGPAYAPS